MYSGDAHCELFVRISFLKIEQPDKIQFSFVYYNIFVLWLLLLLLLFIVFNCAPVFSMRYNMLRAYVERHIEGA